MPPLAGRTPRDRNGFRSRCPRRSARRSASTLGPSFKNSITALRARRWPGCTCLPEWRHGHLGSATPIPSGISTRTRSVRGQLAGLKTTRAGPSSANLRGQAPAAPSMSPSICLAASTAILPLDLPLRLGEFAVGLADRAVRAPGVLVVEQQFRQARQSARAGRACGRPRRSARAATFAVASRLLGVAVQGRLAGRRAGAVFPVGAGAAAIDGELVAIVLLDVLEELGVRARESAWDTRSARSTGGRVGQPGVQGLVVADGPVQKDRVVGILAAAVVLPASFSITCARAASRFWFRAHCPAWAYWEGVHHQHPAAVGAFPPAGTAVLHLGEGIGAVVVDAAAEIADAGAGQKHRQGRLLRGHVADHRTREGMPCSRPSRWANQVKRQAASCEHRPVSKLHRGPECRSSPPGPGDRIVQPLAAPRGT